MWQKNKDKIGSGWNITLTDFSKGMLKAAQQDIGAYPNINYQMLDVQSIPFEDEQYDIAIANHMLYHVPNLDQAISEMYRVLKNNGKLYAATNGKRHMKEIVELIQEFDENIRITRPLLPSEFALEIFGYF